MLINLSLTSGVVPSYFKIATLTPILKSSSLDINELASYRPVSNLPFLAKVLESAVASQLNKHLKKYLSPFQSAFRAGHSVETALCHVTSSIYQSLDKGYDVFLILLDLSAAFDTIHHSLLLKVLHERFNIRGTALKWLESYLNDRYYRVNIRGGSSELFPLTVGVPQGSILGPILFNCIMSVLADLLTQENVDFHIYADDTQLWFSFSPSEECSIRQRISSVFALIEDFMLSHHLKAECLENCFLTSLES